MEGSSSLLVKKKKTEKPCTSLYLYFLSSISVVIVSLKCGDIYRTAQYLVYLGFFLENKVHAIISWSVVQM